jgi:hypothetical protein
MKHAVAASLLAVLFVVGACGNQTATTSPSASSAPASDGSVGASPGPSGSAIPVATTASPSITPSAGPSIASATPTPSSTPLAMPTASPTPAPAIDEFPQSWAGTWADPVTGGSGSLELTLTGKGADFGGSITMDGTACLSGGILTGAYDGRDIEFEVGQRDVEIRFVGRASAAAITGTFASDCDGMDGTWTVTRSSR